MSQRRPVISAGKWGYSPSPTAAADLSKQCYRRR